MGNKNCVGGITSFKRGFNISMFACITEIGNNLTPMFAFLPVDYKSHILHGASFGRYSSSGWFTIDIILDFLNYLIMHVNPNKDKVIFLC